MTKLVVDCRDFYNMAYCHIVDFVRSAVYDRGYSTHSGVSMISSASHDIAMIVIIGSTYLDASRMIYSKDIRTIAHDIEEYLEDELSPPIDGGDDSHLINTLLHTIIETDTFADFWKRYSRIKRRATRNYALEQVSVNFKDMVVIIEVENG